MEPISVINEQLKEFCIEFIMVYENSTGKKINEPSSDKLKIHPFAKFLLERYNEINEFISDYDFYHDYSGQKNLTILGLTLNERALSDFAKSYPKQGMEISDSNFTGGFEKEEIWRKLISEKGDFVERIFLVIDRSGKNTQSKFFLFFPVFLFVFAVFTPEIDGAFFMKEELNFSEFFDYKTLSGSQENILTYIPTSVPRNIILKKNEYLFLEVKSYNPLKKTKKDEKVFDDFGKAMEAFITKTHKFIIPFFMNLPKNKGKELSFRLLFVYNGDFAEDAEMVEKCKTKNQQQSDKKKVGFEVFILIPNCCLACQITKPRRNLSKVKRI